MHLDCFEISMFVGLFSFVIGCFVGRWTVGSGEYYE